MTDPTESADNAPADKGTQLGRQIEPSWRPLYWFIAVLALLIGLGEVFFDLILEAAELVAEAAFYTVEGSEELLEDRIEEWLDLDPYHAEIVTAWTMTPLKILLVIVVLRWLWVLLRKKWLPLWLAHLNRHYLAVRAAWQELFWPYRIAIVVAAVCSLALII
jgi:hypothetical protein